MTVSRRVVLQTLAEQAASKIGFTLRRWWQDAKNPAVLRVEVERRMIGAPPAVGELTIDVPDLVPQRQKKVPPVTTRPRKLRRHQSTTTSSSNRAAQPQKRKASATATKELARSQRKTAKTREKTSQRATTQKATSSQRTSGRKPRK
jgi:hypothetical protein